MSWRRVTAQPQTRDGKRTRIRVRGLEEARVRVKSGIMSSSKGRVAVGALLVSMFLLVFGCAQPAVACQQIPQSGTYRNISVQVAHHMIEEDHRSRILILDVRYQCEYDMGHLYGAVLMPYDQVQANISKFQAYKNQVIIVYCKAGARSQIASEILANNSFTRVCNMEGGILAWIQAGYQIYTTRHYATVGVLDKKIQVQIEPLLLRQTSCSSCSQHGNYTEPCAHSDPQYTILEQTIDYTVIQGAFVLNNTVVQFNATSNLLWTYEKLTDEASRTAALILTEVVTQNSSSRFYTLGYLVRHTSYNLTLLTRLLPLDSEAYGSSVTTASYTSVGKSGLTSLEFIRFNSSTTLSGHYAGLSKVAKEVGKIYSSSGDEKLSQLSKGYNDIANDVRILSKLVRQQLPQYDKDIAQSVAVIEDHCGDWLCLLICSAACNFGCQAGSAIVCTAVCGPICAACITLWGCWGCIICVVVCASIFEGVCYIGSIYTCSPGCGWICCQV